MFLGENGAVFYHGDASAAVVPTEILKNHKSDESLPPYTALLFNDIKDIACREYFMYVLTKSDELYIYHGFNAYDCNNDRERLFKVADSVDEIILGENNRLIVKKTDGEYFMYKIQFR